MAQRVEGLTGTRVLVISPPLPFRPKSGPLQSEPLPQGSLTWCPPFQVFLHCNPVANERYWVLRTVFSSATSRFRAGRRCNRNFELPSASRDVLGHSDSVPIDFVPNRPISAFTASSQTSTRGLLAECFFSSASTGALSDVLLICLSPLSPLSRIWQEDESWAQQAKYAPETEFWDNVSTGHSCENIFLVACLFLKTSKVFPTGFDIPGQRFNWQGHSNHNVIVKIKHRMAVVSYSFGHQSASMGR